MEIIINKNRKCELLINVKTRKNYGVGKNNEINKKYSEVKKIKKDVGNSLNKIIFIKYKVETMKKALIGMKDEKNSKNNYNRGEENKYD